MIKKTTKKKKIPTPKKKTTPKLGEYTKAALERGRGEILYKKVGKKYVQVNDPWATSGLCEGWHLIHVQPGSVSERIRVWPDRIEVEAAILEKSDEIVKILQEALEARPSSRKISREALIAWKQLAKKYSDDFMLLEYRAIQDIADTIVESITRNKTKRNA